MNIVQEEKKGLERVYKVDYFKDEFDSILEHRIEQIANDVQLPGFRKGKVPKNVILSNYKDDIIEYCIQLSVRNACSQIAEDYQEVMLQNIKVDIIEFDHSNEDIPLAFRITAEVLQDLKNVNLADIEHTVYAFEMNDTVRDEIFEKNKNALIEVDEEIQKDDVIYFSVLNHKINDNFDTHPRLNVQNATMQVGNHDFIGGFSDACIGLKRGIHKLSITLDDKFYDVNLRGQTCEFEIDISNILRRTGDKTDEELLKLYNFTKIEELKQAFGEDLQNTIDNKIRQINDSAMFDLVLSYMNSEDIPPKALEQEMESLKHNMVDDRPNQGYFENISDEEINQRVENIAKHNVCLTMFILYFAHFHGITVTEQEVQYVAENIMKLEKLEREQYSYIESYILKTKTLEYIMKKMNTSTIQLSYDEIDKHYLNALENDKKRYTGEYVAVKPKLSKKSAASNNKSDKLDGDSKQADKENAKVAVKKASKKKSTDKTNTQASESSQEIQV